MNAMHITLGMIAANVLVVTLATAVGDGSTLWFVTTLSVALLVWGVSIVLIVRDIP